MHSTALPQIGAGRFPLDSFQLSANCSFVQLATLPFPVRVTPSLPSGRSGHLSPYFPSPPIYGIDEEKYYTTAAAEEDC